jgi:hypothetical protein
MLMQENNNNLVTLFEFIYDLCKNITKGRREPWTNFRTKKSSSSKTVDLHIFFENILVV